MEQNSQTCHKRHFKRDKNSLTSSTRPNPPIPNVATISNWSSVINENSSVTISCMGDKVTSEPLPPLILKYKNNTYVYLT